MIGNILYTDLNSRFTTNFSVMNITDEAVYAGSFSVATSCAIGSTLWPPGTYGVTIGVKY